MIKNHEIPLILDAGNTDPFNNHKDLMVVCVVARKKVDGKWQVYTGRTIHKGLSDRTYYGPYNRFSGDIRSAFSSIAPEDNRSVVVLLNNAVRVVGPGETAIYDINYDDTCVEIFNINSAEAVRQACDSGSTEGIFGIAGDRIDWNKLNVPKILIDANIAGGEAIKFLAPELKDGYASMLILDPDNISGGIIGDGVRVKFLHVDMKSQTKDGKTTHYFSKQIDKSTSKNYIVCESDKLNKYGAVALAALE